MMPAIPSASVEQNRNDSSSSSSTKKFCLSGQVRGHPLDDDCPLASKRKPHQKPRNGRAPSTSTAALLLVSGAASRLCSSTSMSLISGGFAGGPGQVAVCCRSVPSGGGGLLLTDSGVAVKSALCGKGLFLTASTALTTVLRNSSLPRTPKPHTLRVFGREKGLRLNKFAKTTSQTTFHSHPRKEQSPQAQQATRQALKKRKLHRNPTLHLSSLTSTFLSLRFLVHIFPFFFFTFHIFA